jgi:polysaccharide export outer membrane protein
MRLLPTILTATVLLCGRDLYAQSQFALAPGDAIRIQVWREPDLSGEFVINELGVVTLPLLGRMDVVSVPLSELRDKLISAYAVQLRNPSVTVTPLRRVYVLGEVIKPGQYAVDPTISLGGVLALAGGPTYVGDLHRVRVIRNGKVIVGRIDATTNPGMGDIRSNDEIFVDRRSWIDRNSTILASAAISALGIVLSIVLR